MKKVPRCCKTGAETGQWMMFQHIMTKKVRQHLKLAAEVCHSMTYLLTSTIIQTSRWHQWHQEFTLQMNHHQDFLETEDSAATIIAEPTYIYPTSATNLSTV